MSRRYDIEPVGGAYHIFDTEQRPSSIVYLMMDRPIVQPQFNYQVTLTLFNARRHTSRDFYVFSRELYSMQFYAGTPWVHDRVIGMLLHGIQKCEISNPVELAAEFGGTVLNEVVPMPRHTGLN